MHLVELVLHDVRSYALAEVVLEPGVHLLVGPNGQGKTNLVEAVVRVATGRSHRVSTDAPLVRNGADKAVIRARFIGDQGVERRLHVQFGGGRPRVRVDGQDVQRAADALGLLRVVTFAPEDLAIVRGTPAERRAFLDGVLGQRRPLYAASLVAYERVLRQRNALLKQARHDRGALASLGVWDTELVRTAVPLVAARIAATHALAGPVVAAHGRLTGQPGDVRVAYEPSAGAVVEGVAGGGVPEVAGVAQDLRDALAARRADEVARGVTLVGPHRDELQLKVDGLAARHHASQGEAWSIALALRLGSHALLVRDGAEPVVVLDDVFAELDSQRRARLAAICGEFRQVLVTAADRALVPLTGRVHRVTKAGDGTSRITTATSRSLE